MKLINLVLLSSLMGFSSFAVELTEKKIIKEEDLAAMFTKDAKFSAEATDQAAIDKEMVVLDEEGKEASFGSVLLLDECAKLPDENAYKNCKQKVLNNK